jgi:predicted kinase
MTKPLCTVLVGLPGLGKSTYVKSVLKINSNVFIYSTDQFIEEAAEVFGISYNEAFKDNIDAATKSMNSLLDEAIDTRKDIIWDQTNLGVGKRRKIINRMKQADYRVECECFVPPEAGWISDQKVWRDRLNNRPGKTIPSDVLTAMINSYVEPSTEEGFDDVFFWNMYGAPLPVM